MAQLCMSLLAEDDDGHFIVDYLGTEFRRAITQGIHDELYERAQRYVLRQLQQHRSADDAKLAARYARLAEYFVARR